jgi:purine-binding chemotaxis protein CheW
MTLAPNASSPPWSEAGELEALSFDIAGETFALEASMVREILDLLPETAVPGARRFVNTVINFRGKVIPIADIRFAFGMPPAQATIDSRIVVLEVDLEGTPTLVGLRTDKVNEVLTLKRGDSEPPPRVGMKWRQELIACLIKRREAVIIVPDMLAILNADRRNTVAEA